MAFKMNRPAKMHGPRKSSINKYGKTADSGLYYNSKMGPMQMHSPSALKQMEEGMEAEGGGMEEMMGMMGGGAPEGGGPAEGAPVEKEGAKQIFGQEMKVKEDGTIVIDSETGIEGVPPGAEVKDPDGILEFTEDGGDKYVMDENYTFEVEGNTVIITGVEEGGDPNTPAPGAEGMEPPVE